MIIKKTVMVIGAGASSEVNLPLGSELTNHISNLLNFEWQAFHNEVDSGDNRIFSAIVKQVGGLDDIDSLSSYLEMGKHISEAMSLTQSIDQFIHTHRGNERIEFLGKLAIVKAILDAERSSLMLDNIYHENEVNLPSIANTWYVALFKLIASGTGNRIKDIKQSLQNITFIIFNYDRCVEYFFYKALKTHFLLSDNEAANLVSGMNIYHPYGQVGYLPWEGRKPSIGFGKNPSSNELLELSSHILTFTEGTDPNKSKIAGIKQCMREAELLIFLGFAYYEQNMSLLTPHNIPEESIRCLGTAFNMSDANREVVDSEVKKVRKMPSMDYRLCKETERCVDLINNYERIITGS